MNKMIEYRFRMEKFEMFKRLWIFNYISFTRIKVVPVIGIDFSNANIDEDNKINFHNDDHNSNYSYRKIVNKFLKKIKFFSTENMLPFMFGCKLDEEGETLDWWPMSNDESQIQMLPSKFDKWYKEWLEYVTMSSPVNHSTIFK